MDLGYSSLFTSGLRQQNVPTTPPRQIPTTQIMRSYSDYPLPIVAPAIPPSPRPKMGRKRRSSITISTNPMAAIKSPARQARSALMSPVRENNKRFFDFFGNTSIGGAVNLLRLRGKKKLAAQKPVPSVPLPHVPTEQQQQRPPLPSIYIGSGTPSGRSRRMKSSTSSASSINPPSSPTFAFEQETLQNPRPFNLLSSLPSSSPFHQTQNQNQNPPQSKSQKLRVLTSELTPRSPFSPGFMSNASSPTFLSPDYVYSPTTPFTTSSSATMTNDHHHVTGGSGYFDWKMSGVMEECEDMYGEGDDTIIA